ncbi:hypothetical protein AB0M58_13765 [Streptomyces bobili]|uniref:hypothetical protein n=1 Tax=Streptomyces bobili TaxID=67280 RepID=UPI003449836A
MNMQSLAVDAGPALGSYYLGASGLIPDALHRLRIRTRRVLVWCWLKPGWHPARWAYEGVAHVRSAWSIALAFTFHPRKATVLLRQMLPLFPFRQPTELKDAVAEAARLHVPGKSVISVRFAVYTGSCDLSNVTFRHGRAPADVTRITLGGNPDHMGSPKPGQGTRAELAASRDRVEAALAALPIGPAIKVLTVRVEKTASR